MPNFDIESFRSNFGDGARQNLFYFLPTFPPDAIEGDMGNEKSVYLVRNTSLPGVSLEEINVPWQGYDFYIGGKHTFEALTVTFNCDREAKIRLNFENWVNKIHDPITNEYAPISTYMLPQRMQLLGLDGTPTLEYTLQYAWPQAVGAATVDYATSDIVQFDVTFRYIYHTVSSEITGL